jgi:hypothetical protein
MQSRFFLKIRRAMALLDGLAEPAKALEALAALG